MNYFLVAIVGLLLLIALLTATIKLIQEYERGVVIRLGRVARQSGPGVVFIIPFLESLVVIDMRMRVVDVPPQDVITRDNITLQVDAVAYSYVQNPVPSALSGGYINIDNDAQIALRQVVGQFTLDDLLTKRAQINRYLQKSVDLISLRWGIRVSQIGISDIKLPSSMIRSMARQAEAERWKRAQLIRVAGELQAAEQLSQAAQIIGASTGALQLRALYTLNQIGVEQKSTLLFPIPLEFR